MSGVLVWNPVIMATALVLLSTGALMLGYAFRGVESAPAALRVDESNVVLVATKRGRKSKKNQ